MEHTIAHETEHQFDLAPDAFVPRKLTDHFSEGSGYVLDRSVVFDNKTKQFGITVINHDGSKANVRLK